MRSKEERQKMLLGYIQRLGSYVEIWRLAKEVADGMDISIVKKDVEESAPVKGVATGGVSFKPAFDLYRAVYVMREKVLRYGIKHELFKGGKDVKFTPDNLDKVGHLLFCHVLHASSQLPKDDAEYSALFTGLYVAIKSIYDEDSGGQAPPDPVDQFKQDGDPPKPHKRF